ncbi:MAG: metallophosphoesterase [Nitrospirae bacterium]|nr:MAG: metallophosphoesterase [Nitrospirota bacterium]
MPSFAVISDVHANLEALEAVLRDIDKRGVEEIHFTGDVVGYGPDPERCIHLVQENCSIRVAGNHDWAVLGLTPVYYFNDNARAAVEWTMGVLTETEMDILRGYEIIGRSARLNAVFVHGSPDSPDAWEYVLSVYDAERGLRAIDERFCFIGHSHVPFVIEKVGMEEPVIKGVVADIREGARYMINSGSVGQPRDGDPRAAYLLFSDERLEIIRVEYPVSMTQAKMEKLGLPYPLIIRLAEGR